MIMFNLVKLGKFVYEKNFGTEAVLRMICSFCLSLISNMKLLDVDLFFTYLCNNFSFQTLFPQKKLAGYSNV